ncbi:MAG: hypothetical protein ISR79_06030 [Nitrosopumilus sp.]|nr:hypothetical protein [Nitrosopumilus sp.]
MYEGITIALIIITDHTGKKVPNSLSGTFNENAIGIATKTATNARLEYGGSSDLPFLDRFLKKKKEGVLIIVIT